MKILGSFLFCCLTISCLAQDCLDQKQFLKRLRMEAVIPTPEPDNVETHIFFPEEKEIYKKEDIYTWVRIQGYPLGVYSDFPRAKILRNDPMGQSMHISIDNYPWFAVYRDLINALDPNEYYFDESFNVAIPFDLEPGEHVIRAYPVRSYGESLKGRKTYMARSFFIDEKIDNKSMDISLPYLTYNEPQGEFEFSLTRPILLDFYLQNALLAPDGYKVRLSINDEVINDLVIWAPYYIYGLPIGEHNIRLQLFDPDNKLVPCVFNDVVRTIIIK